MSFYLIWAQNWNGMLSIHDGQITHHTKTDLLCCAQRMDKRTVLIHSKKWNNGSTQVIFIIFILMVKTSNQGTLWLHTICITNGEKGNFYEILKDYKEEMTKWYI